MSTPHRITVPAALIAGLVGLVLGLATFAAAAALWRAGQGRIGGLAAEAILVTALTLVAAVALLAQPARQRRARVPAGRAVPHAWWPPAAPDPLPTLAVWACAPVAAGAGAAVLLFR